MKQKLANSNEKNDKFKSKRIKVSTLNAINDFLKKVNDSEDTGKVSFDDVVNYFLENVTKSDIEKLQLRRVTWVHEEKRLRKLYEKKKGKTSEDKWKKMLCLGELKVFFNENSRLPLEGI